jgi:hypothetical protein
MIFPSCFAAIRRLAMVLPCAVLPLAAQNPAPVQTFYLPVPEGQLLQILQSIEGGSTWISNDLKPANPVQYYISITAVADGTVIYYDHMEDGYESEISTPTSVYVPSATPPAPRSGGMGIRPTGRLPAYRAI